MTINEGMIWMKTLRERHAELVNLRNENSAEQTRRYGVGGDREVTKTPVYDVKHLDKLITRLAREMRTLDTKIKLTNAATEIRDYTADDAALGEVA